MSHHLPAPRPRRTLRRLACGGGSKVGVDGNGDGTRGSVIGALEAGTTERRR